MKSFLSLIGSALWMILRVLLVIALLAVGVYCLSMVFLHPLIWEGLAHLAGAAVCALLLFLILRRRAEEDGDSL